MLGRQHLHSPLNSLAIIISQPSFKVMKKTREAFQGLNVADTEAEAKANKVMESAPTSLSQPWKSWYKAETSLDINPLNKPISLGRARQGSLPQKPRQVDLSNLKTPKTPSTDSK